MEEKSKNKNERKVILTGDRPTGKLHLGHYVGSLQRRVELQNSGEYDEINILIADDQALTDNYDNPKKIRDNIIEVALDYLSVGIDPAKSTICIQSALPALHALSFYYLNLVTTQRLSRNPTVKAEMKQKGYSGENENDNEAGLPAGFFTYPVSQAADITAFKATTVPVGEDQLPMIEQTKEIVRRFNQLYQREVLLEPEILLPKNSSQRRLPGIDGKAKMSKSLGNGIYLSDDEKTVKTKIMSMYTDPSHINITDPGHVEGNTVFTYLDAFSKQEDFAEFLPEYANLEEMKEHYRRGGLGDVKCKKFLLKVMENMLSPIREERKRWENRISDVYDILYQGTEKAKETTNATLEEVRDAMRINYFKGNEIIGEWDKWVHGSQEG
ncbi:tryptophan--tRNA ligase [Oribacterium sp. oral taxon 108]|uniref:tryptophan--tRNA ligase n=1 Tax=Oribacterium sp. oral taxon 108 TaxID=712414 RepID=UPI00020DD93A|nr:tryptophan--tRNA ligase [Oribacterium sp. oral taxon 108]EGL36829.1 tryptophan--tRNA ligase [Oribacterium sp. oral taxon 108 str. F0425]